MFKLKISQWKSTDLQILFFQHLLHTAYPAKFLKWTCPLHFWNFRYIKMKIWWRSANSIEPGLTARTCRLAWLYTGGKGLITFGSSRIRVNGSDYIHVYLTIKKGKYISSETILELKITKFNALNIGVKMECWQMNWGSIIEKKYTWNIDLIFNQYTTL